VFVEESVLKESTTGRKHDLAKLDH